MPVWLDIECSNKAHQGALMSEGIISLWCEGSGGPGWGWQADLRVIENRAGRLEVWQTNGDSPPRHVRRKVLGRGPAWREFLSFLILNQPPWCLDIEAPWMAGSTGVEGWQETALLLCWFREDDDKINRGMQLGTLSDAQVAVVCRPYKALDGVRSLWSALGTLEEMVRLNPKTNGKPLGQVLELCGCWKSENPVQSAIGRLKREQEDFEIQAQSIESEIAELIGRAIRGWERPRTAIQGMGRSFREGEVEAYVLFYFRANGSLPSGKHQIPSEVSGRSHFEVDFGSDPVE